jgi:hypothetical protein
MKHSEGLGALGRRFAGKQERLALLACCAGCGGGSSGSSGSGATLQAIAVSSANKSIPSGGTQQSPPAEASATVARSTVPNV